MDNKRIKDMDMDSIEDDEYCYNCNRSRDVAGYCEGFREGRDGNLYCIDCYEYLFE